MRWKLVIIASVAASLIASGLWCALVAILVGPAAAVTRHDWMLASLAIPLGIAVIAGFFVYRHTSRRRKTQALLTLAAVLLLTSIAYLIAATLAPNYFDLQPPAHPSVPSSARGRVNGVLISLQPALPLVPAQFLSAPASTRQSQTEYVRPTLRPTQPRPDEYHRD